MTEPMHDLVTDHLDLAEWRRRVAELYASDRADPRAGPIRAVAYRSARDRLFGSHPSSAIPHAERHNFRGLASFRHEPMLALRARFEPDPDATPASKDT